LANGSLKVRELVGLYLRRIERVNPALNAFISVRPGKALDEADQAQRLLDDGDERPLLGIPFAVKDEHHVAGEITSFGGTPATTLAANDDDDVVRVLRDAGAIPIGKTALPELGMHPFTESPTWGITRNPWDLSRTPGGSSGGSAAAVASGLASFATAGDGGGSIRIPASCCNLFGLKVQSGTLASPPHLAGTGDLSVPGVLTRRVADAALLYDLLANDRMSSHEVTPAWGTSLVSAAEDLKRDRLRVGLAFNVGAPAHVAPEVHDVVVSLAHRLEARGHEVVDAKVDPGRWDLPFALLGMRVLVEEARLLEDPGRLDRRTRSVLRTGSFVNARLVHWALRRQHTITARTNRVFDDLDLVLTPTLAKPPVEVGRWHGRGSLRTSLGVARWCPFTSLANLIGNPAASVPAGFTGSGLPVGAQMLAPPGGEPTLIAVATQLESDLRWYDTFPAL